MSSWRFPPVRIDRVAAFVMIQLASRCRSRHFRQSTLSLLRETAECSCGGGERTHSRDCRRRICSFCWTKGRVSNVQSDLVPVRTRLLRQGAHALDAFVRLRLADSVVLETAFRGSVSERRRFSMSVLQQCNARLVRALVRMGEVKDKGHGRNFSCARASRPTMGCLTFSRAFTLPDCTSLVRAVRRLIRGPKRKTRNADKGRGRNVHAKEQELAQTPSCAAARSARLPTIPTRVCFGVGLVGSIGSESPSLP